MRRIFQPLLLLAAILAALSLQAAEVSPFANFAGSYPKHGTVSVSDGGGSAIHGRAAFSFNIGAGGSGRLKITGTLKYQDASRPFTSLYIFTLANKKRGPVARFSNLAPGVDDGRAADGTYTATPRSIRANASFHFGTTGGAATVLVRLSKRPQGTRLRVIQTLSTGALTRPITWTFTARSR